MGVLQEDAAPATDPDTPLHKPRLVRKHMERLHTLGIGPSRQALKNHFGTMGAYGAAAEVRTGKNTLYGDWPLATYVRYAESLAYQLERKPKESDYKDAHLRGAGPSLLQITQRAGGIRKLNESIGYPDIHEWDTEDYLEWGMRVAKANPGGTLTTRLLNHLSRRERGPSPSTIANKFGSLRVFQREIDAFREGVPIEETPHRTAYDAKFALAENLLPPVLAHSFERLSQLPISLFLDTLQDLRPSLRLKDIETAATSLDTSQESWPIDDWRDYLHVPVEHLGYVHPGNQERFTARLSAID